MKLTNVHDVAQLLNISEDRVCLVGSQRIIGEGNDWDFLVLHSDPERLTACGFSEDLEGSFYPSAFRSWRRGDVNLIVTHDESFFVSECTVAEAARVAAHGGHDLTTRDGRVAFHGTVRDSVRHHLDAHIPAVPVPGSPLFEF